LQLDSRRSFPLNYRPPESQVFRPNGGQTEPYRKRRWAMLYQHCSAGRSDPVDPSAQFCALGLHCDGLQLFDISEIFVATRRLFILQ